MQGQVGRLLVMGALTVRPAAPSLLIEATPLTACGRDDRVDVARSSRARLDSVRARKLMAVEPLPVMPPLMVTGYRGWSR